MAGPSLRASVVFFAALALVVGAACVVSCGPSDLERKLAVYKPAIERRLDAEDSAFRQVHALAQDQDDPGIAKRYRRHLEDVALPFYVAFEKEVAALEPGHADLAVVREALVAYAKYRREFVVEQVANLALRAKVPDLEAIQRANEDTNALHAAYAEIVREGVPDGRLADVTGSLGGFLNGPYRRALEGSMETEQALTALRKDYRPRLIRLRADRFDDTPSGRAFRAYVVAADDHLALLERLLPSLIEVVRAKDRVEAALNGATAERKKIAEALRAAELKK